MPVTRGFKDFVKDQLADFGPVTIRNMFGGAGICADGVMFALLADDTLYFKADEASARAFAAEGMSPFTYDPPGKQPDTSKNPASSNEASLFGPFDSGLFPFRFPNVRHQERCQWQPSGFLEVSSRLPCPIGRCPRACWRSLRSLPRGPARPSPLRARARQERHGRQR